MDTKKEKRNHKQTEKRKEPLLDWGHLETQALRYQCNHWCIHFRYHHHLTRRRQVQRRFLSLKIRAERERRRLSGHPRRVQEVLLFLLLQLNGETTRGANCCSKLLTKFCIIIASLFITKGVGLASFTRGARSHCKF
jgi:hypothetical protein